MLREMPSVAPILEEESAPESGEVPTDFTVERVGDALRFILRNEEIRDAFSHVILDRFSFETVHQRRVEGVLQITVDHAGILTDEEVDQIKEEVTIARKRTEQRYAGKGI